MDTKTLIVAGLMLALVTTLSMAIVFWTRRTYPGFGYWLAGAGCRVLAGALFLFPRDRFPPWLTIVLANYLMLAEILFYLRGTLIFRGRAVGYGWEIAASISFIALFLYFSYIAPSLNVRIEVWALYSSVWEIWIIWVLLTQRPPYFGSIDRWQAGVWGGLAAVNLFRAGYLWMFVPPPADYLHGPAYMSLWILLLIVTSLLIAMSQILMNAQRLEYDLRMTQGQLKQDILKRQQAEKNLKISEERHRLLAENANDVIWTMSLDGRITYISPAIEAVRGFTPEEAMRQSLDEILTPESQAISIGYFNRLQESAYAGLPLETFRGELEYWCKDGSTFWTEVMARPLLGPDGACVEILGVTRDIAAHKAAEAQLKASELRMRTMLDHIPTAIFVASLEPDPRVIFSNAEFLRTFGYTQEEIPRVSDWIKHTAADAHDHAATVEWWNAAVAEMIHVQEKIESRELRVTCKNGDVRDAILNATAIEEMLLASCVDITERKRDETQLQQAREVTEAANQALREANANLHRLATTDTLTGVWNRRYFEEMVAHEIACADRYGDPSSLLMLDIDHFKSINDGYGHQTGDDVLVELTQRIGQALRGVDLLARWGGEEFVVMMTHCMIDEAAMLAERLRALVANHPFPVVGKVTSSFGVAQRGPQETLHAWLKRVDSALYRAKHEGRNRVEIDADTPQPTLNAVEAILVRLLWNDRFLSGHPVIDRQHRALFDDANHLLTAILSNQPIDEVGRHIETLVRDVVQHFQDEEGILMAVGYPEVTEHAALHRELVDHASALVERFHAGTLAIGDLFQFLAHDVVAKHMLCEDCQFFSYLPDAVSVA